MSSPLRQSKTEPSASQSTPTSTVEANRLSTAKAKSVTGHLQNWAESHLERLRSWVEKRYAKEIALVEQEGKERAARNELALFAHPAIRFGVFICTLIVFVTILQFTAPPRGIKKALIGQSVVYVPNAELCFGVGCLNDPARIHAVTLPFFDLQSIRDFQDHDLFYRFRINLDEAHAKRGLDTFYSPLIWGDADVYRGESKVASGPMFRPIVPLSLGLNELMVHVRSPSGQKLGIRGITPPFLCNSSTARDLEKEINGEPFQIQYSFVAQIAGLGLLLVMFLTFPYRPELFGFLVLFGIETLRAKLHYIFDEGRILFSPIIDKLAYNGLLVLGAITLVSFIVTFFRRPLRSITRFLLRYLGAISIGLLVGYFGLTSIFRTLSGENALFISIWTAALMLSFALVKDTFLFLLKQRNASRLLLALTAVFGVAYWSGVNIRDHFVLSTEITTVYSNHLHFFFFMSVVLGVEIGRTEIKIKEAFSLLPKEVVRLIHDRKESWREGFVILVDVVGWTSRLKVLNEVDTPVFMKVVNEYMLSFFDEPGASVIAGTGDGFYITFEGKPSCEQFQKLAMACTRLAQSRPTFGSLGIRDHSIKSERIIVRSALGYGKYYIGFVENTNIKKEFLAGFLATLLSRMIGNDPDPRGPRILSGAALDQFKELNEISIQETKGEQIAYWQFKL
jgi:hypothetical protein